MTGTENAERDGAIAFARCGGGYGRATPRRPTDGRCPNRRSWCIGTRPCARRTKRTTRCLRSTRCWSWERLGLWEIQISAPGDTG